MPPKKAKRKVAKHKRKRSTKKRVTKTRIEIPVPSIRRSTCEQTYKNYKSVQLLGGGEFGEVYLMCNEAKKCPYVVKVYYIDPKDVGRTFAKFEQEVKMQKVAAKLGIAPKVYDAWTCDTEGKGRRNIYKDEWVPFPFQAFNVMERMDGSLHQFMIDSYGKDEDEQPLVDRVPVAIRESWFKQVEKMLNKFHKIGLRHGSIGSVNILYKRRGNDVTGKKIRLYLGDFEEARHIDGRDDKIVGEIGTRGTDLEQLMGFRKDDLHLDIGGAAHVI